MSNEVDETTMGAPGALIMVRMNAPAVDEAAWNEWYHHAHIASRLAMPGWLAVRRFQVSEVQPGDEALPAAKYLALYELADLEALKGEQYLKRRHDEACGPPDSFEAITDRLDLTGGLYDFLGAAGDGGEIPAGQFLLAVADAMIPPEIEDEYNAWYDTEHLPACSAIPGLLAVRRFRVSAAEIPNATVLGPYYLALYHLAEAEVVASEAFRRASATPWGTRIRRITQAQREMRSLYRCIYSGRKGAQ